MASPSRRYVVAAILGLTLLAALVVAVYVLLFRRPAVHVHNGTSFTLSALRVASRAEHVTLADLASGQTYSFRIRTIDSDEIFLYYSLNGTARVADCGLLDSGESRAVTILEPGDRYVTLGSERRSAPATSLVPTTK